MYKHISQNINIFHKGTSSKEQLYLPLYNISKKEVFLFMNENIENKIERSEIIEENENTRSCKCMHKNYSCSCANQNMCMQKNYMNMNTEDVGFIPQLKIGDMAPEFIANTTFGEVRLGDYRGRWLVFFSHPGDFTPVCTTEFLAFANCYLEFKRLNTELLGLSIDSNPSHLAWTYNIYKNSGVKIPFPIVADRDAAIAKMYNMVGLGMVNYGTIRSTYIIDPNGVIRLILTYPKEIGRNIGEIIRIIEALQMSDANDVATPANWVPGMPVIVKSPNTYQELVERMQNSNEYSCFDWYLCFKNMNMTGRNLGGDDNGRI